MLVTHYLIQMGQLDFTSKVSVLTPVLAAVSHSVGTK